MSNSNNSTKTNDEISTGHSDDWSGLGGVWSRRFLQEVNALSPMLNNIVNSEHADSTLCYFWSEVISDRKQLRLKNILDTESLELLGGCSHDSTLDFEDTNSVTTEMAKKIKTNKNENEDVYYNLGEDDESEITQKKDFNICHLRVKKNTIGFRRDSIELAPSPQEQLNFLRQIKESTSNICKNCCSKINHNELINDDLSDD
ncbi:11396_t:CDS:2 [Entrophospora sp. SA101]|nr:11396_t:CDS:2 [Entrophospora sp. SA101]